MKHKHLVQLIAISLLLGMSTTGFAAGDIRSPEYQKMGALDYIDADLAYAKGYTGKGVMLCIHDTVIRRIHPDFAGKQILSPDAYVDKDSNFHGTHVAGIVSANKDDLGMHGIAYNANLMYFGFSDIASEERNYAFLANYPEVKVINNSFGLDYYLEYQNLANYGDADSVTSLNWMMRNTVSPRTETDEDLKELRLINDSVNKDKLFVFAASNEGHLSTSLFTGISTFYNFG